ncbi:putative ABC1 transport protein [Fusarium fujikuroi]|nr:putative ABC1 transport protein [Fusarium fujikuroi]
MASTYMGGTSVQPAQLPGLGPNVTANNQTTASAHEPHTPVNPSSDTTPTNYSQDHVASKDEAPAKSTTEDEEDSELERRHSIVRDLARQYTNQSQMSAISGNPFTADENSPLNPRSDKFRALAWAKAISKLHSETGFTNRKAGVCYQNLNVFGYGQPTDYQKNVANIWLDVASLPRQLMGYGKTRIDIIRDFDGVVKNGEMLVVLGPPGSGCSTYLKTISGETSGIYINDDAYFNYRGITAHEMHTRHRGEAIYTAEVDVHFPHLTVGDTLDFAAHARIRRLWSRYIRLRKLLMIFLTSALEILTLYAQRPIVEKHDRYALYHPSSEAVASMLCDMPYKILNAFTYNLTLYFMTNLRREPGPFFFFLFITFLVTLCMSMIFRTIASASRTLSQAMVPAALLILALVTFTGFVIQIDYMLGWCRWINYVNPLAYAFESLMVNEFHNRKFECNLFIPTYPDAAPENRVCSTVGAVQGEPMVSGDRYINLSFSYYHAHKWRNVGIVIAFTLLFLATYMFFAETVSAKKSKGEVLVFRRGHRLARNRVDAESSPAGRVAITEKEGYGEGQPSNFKSTSVFHWNNVCYDIKIKSENRRILDNVAGWVKPGTMTALMGVSGAGKTTLLDCLADRTSMGVIHGDILVDDKLRDASFQRKTGYVQQQDLHLSTTTVREALNFSAIMRQPKHIPVKQKIAYVDEVIKMLDMQDYSEAVVGVLGEGLNVEQRKRLTIGVELAAKPPVLLFVDEPTSGLDSQTSWAILDLLEKLARSGQAILCTIHQPSAMLFQRFDRLLFLASGGKTVYFGDVGDHSRTMTQYFESHGAEPCPLEANPAEWMLEVIGAAPGSETDLDWPQIWRDSSEFAEVQKHLQELSHHRVEKSQDEDPHLYDEFAATFTTQLKYVTTRVFEQYWRTPSYIYSKAALCTLVALFIGFSFYQAPNTALGLQNQMFAIFQVLTVFGQLTQQQMPHFVIQRDLYEVRERPSKTYSWQVFILSQIIVEIPWNTLMAAIMYFCWYYPIGLYRNAEPTDAVAERGALMFLLFLVFMLFTCTFTDFIIAGCSSAETGGNIANLLFMMCLIFCGVLAPPDSFPKFWIWMYRVSPFTYLISAILSTAVANTEAVCAQNEYVVFPPPEGKTCGEYMQAYIKSAGGYLVDESSNSTCTYCTIGDSNVFLARVQSHYDERWRNFGLMWVYIIFNVFAALALYWLVRVPKNKKGEKEKKE